MSSRDMCEKDGSTYLQGAGRIGLLYALDCSNEHLQIFLWEDPHTPFSIENAGYFSDFTVTPGSAPCQNKLYMWAYCPLTTVASNRLPTPK